MNSARLREPALHLGTWLSTGSPVIAELAALSGFDWLLIDLEHGSASESAVIGQLQAIRAAGGETAAIVRVGAPHPDLIARVLDWGADGIMVPHVSSAAEAHACVRAALYPPAGKRGLSRSVRAMGYGLRPLGAGETPFVFAQIENLEGVEACAEIATVPGIDALFVGPADLRLDLEARAAQATRSYEECLLRVAEAAAAARKSCGILLRESAEIARHQGWGYTKVALDSDLGLLRAGYQGLVQAARAPGA